jgi:hypothetical protein
MRARAELLGLPDGRPAPEAKQRLEAVVLKVNSASARVRLLADGTQLTFRSSGVAEVIPGHLVTLVVGKRWTWCGDAYASGKFEDARLDVAKLGLVPLPLLDGALCDVRTMSEPFRRPDPYAPLWRKLTAKRRASFQFDPIAWGAFPDDTDPDDIATCNAAELAEAGDEEGARTLLMEVLLRDLRCLDAHAHLGNLKFERSPTLAMQHYEMGIAIGELSLPKDFDGLLLWGPIYNRPFLRCLKGLGQCLWRLGRAAEALTVFERILAFSPNDNQGIRFLREDLLKGQTWEQAMTPEKAASAAGGALLH